MEVRPVSRSRRVRAEPRIRGPVPTRPFDASGVRACPARRRLALERPARSRRGGAHRGRAPPAPKARPRGRAMSWLCTMCVEERVAYVEEPERCVGRSRGRGGPARSGPEDASRWRIARIGVDAVGVEAGSWRHRHHVPCRDGGHQCEMTSHVAYTPARAQRGGIPLVRGPTTPARGRCPGRTPRTADQYSSFMISPDLIV